MKQIKLFSYLLLSVLSIMLAHYVHADTQSNMTNQSCPQALPASHSNFCASFKKVAICHCTSSGLPPTVCQDMESIYNRMVGMFGSVERACEYQHDTSKQVCIEDWRCYRSGGEDSKGNLCSATGYAC
jgi:hypothetical protein